MEVWNKERALTRLMGKAALLNQVVGIFLRQLPERLADINNRFAESDWQGLRQAAHKLKGSAGEISAEVLFHHLQALEKAAIDNDATEASRQLSETTLAANELQPVLENEIS